MVLLPDVDDKRKRSWESWKHDRHGDIDVSYDTIESVEVGVARFDRETVGAEASR